MQDWSRLGALLAGTGAALMATAPAQAEATAWRFHSAGALGTYLDVVAVTADRSEARGAAEAALAEIARLDAVLSGWRDDSELSIVNRCRDSVLSDDLHAVLSACEAWRERTTGAFDARQGEAFARMAAGEDAGPLAALPPQLEGRRLHRPEAVRFAPEALAKGYVVDQALAAARSAAPGVRGLMIDIGGDLRCWGEGPRGGWTAGLAAPGAADDDAPALLVRTADRALATSAPLREGRRHILGATPDMLQAAVLAPTAADADALATALCAMPIEAGLALAESLDGFEARLVDAAGRAQATTGWSAAVAEPSASGFIRAAAAAPAAAAGPAWPRGFALSIDYELPNKGARAYSPYIAVWVTDDAGRLVRAIQMLGDNLDYVPENYVWWRRYGRARPELVAAVSRPTKPAGRYTVTWDGHDDQGRPVPQGKYTLHLESTREDGDHSYQSVSLDLRAQAAQASAPAQDELGATTVRYGRR